MQVEDVESRSSCVLTVMLTIVTFNYVCQDKIPKVPYSTILDGFLIAQHVFILVVFCIILFFSYLANHIDTEISVYDGLKPGDETIVASILFFIWIFGTLYFGCARRTPTPTPTRTHTQTRPCRIFKKQKESEILPFVHVKAWLLL